MKLKSNQFIFISLFVTFLFSFPAQLFGQKSDQDILNTFIDKEYKDITLIYVLDTIRQEYDIPIVFEVADSGYISGNSKDLNTYDMNLKAGKLEDILDAIIKLKPNYKWEIIDGVVNFTPIKNRNPFIEKLFNTQIKTFSLKSFVFSSEIDRKLEVIPEVKNLLEFNATKVNDIYFVDILRGATYPENKVDLVLYDVTFKEIVNAIAKKSPANFWLVHLKTSEYDGKIEKILYL